MEKLVIDKAAITMGDWEAFEELVGEPLQKALRDFQQGAATAKAMTALLWIARRQENPDYTIDEARKDFTLTDLEGITIQEPSPDSDPTDAASAS